MQRRPFLTCATALPASGLLLSTTAHAQTRSTWPRWPISPAPMPT